MSDSGFGLNFYRNRGLAMHTDEYEISIGREIALCRKMVKQLKNSLERREKQYGMTTAAFLQALEKECLSEQHPIQSWNQEYQDLQYWQKMLTEYEEALESLKWI
jgi:hypothetical protein